MSLRGGTIDYTLPDVKVEEEKASKAGKKGEEEEEKAIQLSDDVIKLNCHISEVVFFDTV
eukprot:CAMPEP_0201285834 /NCGR_PEP_ID=MMETSP1317-20130820/113885_1 /ASSEMBLY_ACC=CAM_ASM_000770 /TAXON_ID=187299 /ORGANISM="Undescribed Undescribed, Strain Undescribed" /LENGTH=59 /DNA_ID=CAMNT_0047611859 /DNA_START=197 /DNA_END=376 /DNA_ORIENTATION=-